MKKRILTIGMILVLCFLFCSCGEGSSSTPVSGGNASFEEVDTESFADSSSAEISAPVSLVDSKTDLWEQSDPSDDATDSQPDLPLTAEAEAIKIDLMAKGANCFYLNNQPTDLDVKSVEILRRKTDAKNDEVRIDGNMAIAWSKSLQFTVEKSTKSLLGSIASGEGVVNVYRGTGRILMAPVTYGTLMNQSNSSGEPAKTSSDGVVGSVVSSLFG